MAVGAPKTEWRVMQVRVRVWAAVYPTEDPEKVVRAVRKIFPAVELRVSERGGMVFVEGESQELAALSYLKENWRRRRVRSAVLRLLRSSVEGRVLKARLSKQGAYVGVASVLDEDEKPAIGEINLEVETDDVERLIKWMTS
jgi:predicted RNA binding protein with dsRBD fold (UPF0201 family)